MGKETARRPAGAADSQSLGRTSPILALDDGKLVLAATDRMNHLACAHLTRSNGSPGRGADRQQLAAAEEKAATRPRAGQSFFAAGFANRSLDLAP